MHVGDVAAFLSFKSNSLQNEVLCSPQRNRSAVCESKTDNVCVCVCVCGYGWLCGRRVLESV